MLSRVSSTEIHLISGSLANKTLTVKYEKENALYSPHNSEDTFDIPDSCIESVQAGMKKYGFTEDVAIQYLFDWNSHGFMSYYLYEKQKPMVFKEVPDHYIEFCEF